MRRVHRIRAMVAVVLACSVLGGGVARVAGQPVGTLSDAEIRKILGDRIASRPETGIVVGLIDAGGRRVIAVGPAGVSSSAALDGGTVFEIGSATKVFTGTLLATMVDSGDVRLDDPVSKFLPPTVTVPARNGKTITLLDLATQTSGLPRLPANLAPKDPRNPYADYTVQQLYDFLSGYQLPVDSGVRFEYSNAGMGLLGHALGLRASSTFEELVARRVLEPLAMRDTAITLSPTLAARLAPGHDRDGHVAANWDLPTLAGAGALRSTVNDQLRFLAANLDANSPLATAFALAHLARRSLGTPDGSIGLAWLVRRSFDTEFVWHNGQTGGYRSFIGFDRRSGRGVVILHNGVTNTDDIGFHLLDSRFPLAAPPAPPRTRVEIVLDEGVVQTYVGDYDLAPGFALAITREAGQLFLQATGQGRLPLFAESPADFFLKVVDAQVTFTKDASGQVTGLVLHQNGRDMPARRR